MQTELQKLEKLQAGLQESQEELQEAQGEPQKKDSRTRSSRKPGKAMETETGMPCSKLLNCVSYRNPLPPRRVYLLVISSVMVCLLTNLITQAPVYLPLIGALAVSYAALLFDPVTVFRSTRTLDDGRVVVVRPLVGIDALRVGVIERYADFVDEIIRVWGGRIQHGVEVSAWRDIGEVVGWILFDRGYSLLIFVLWTWFVFAAVRFYFFLADWMWWLDDWPANRAWSFMSWRCMYRVLCFSLVTETILPNG